MAKSKSSLVTGIVIGVIIGLALATGTATYITKAPIPFMDKISPHIEEILATGGYGVDDTVGIESDPNHSLYAGNLIKNPPVFQGREAQIASELGRIATPSPTAVAPKPTAPTPALTPAPAPTTPPVASTAPSSGYYLQAGAFRSAHDADAMRARILMLGLEVNVQQGAFDGGTINRVRVGPFNGTDAMNQARALLSKEKIETSIVRP